MSTLAPAPSYPGRLLLIRHGETEANASMRACGWTDVPLTAKGAAQAQALADHIHTAYRVDHIYASPLRRAWQTAEAIVHRTGLRPEPHPDLREIHFGEVEGLHWEAVVTRYPELWAQVLQPNNLDLRWPGGESRRDFRARVRRALAPLEELSRERVVAVVCHGGVVASYLSQRLGGDEDGLTKYNVRNCSVTEIGWQADRPVLCALDQVAHLDGLSA